MDAIVIPYMPFWERYVQQFRESGMTAEQVGLLIFAMADFHFYDKEPEDLPAELKFCWAFLRSDMLHAKKRYLASVKNGKKGGRPKKIRQEEEPLVQKTVSVSPVEEPFPEAQSEPPQTQPEEAPHREKKQTEAACSYGEYGWVKLTSAQYRNLAEEMGEAELLQCISYIDEAAQSTQNKNRWKDWFLLLRRCHRDHWHRRPTKEPIPKGASGTLGDAELEAIQRVLREE